MILWREAPTACHTVQTVREMLQSADFQKLSETEPWELKAGGRYFTIRGMSAILKQKGAGRYEKGLVFPGGIVRRTCGRRAGLPQDETISRDSEQGGTRRHTDRRGGRPHGHLCSGPFAPFPLAHGLGAWVYGGLPLCTGPRPVYTPERALNRRYAWIFSLFGTARRRTCLFLVGLGETAKNKAKFSCKKEKKSLAIWKVVWYYNQA